MASLSKAVFSNTLNWTMLAIGALIGFVIVIIEVAVVVVKCGFYTMSCYLFDK